MASTEDFIEFVCSQIDSEYSCRYRKMFGSYMVYVHEKPVLLVCDNVVFIKKLEFIKGLMINAETGIPYPGAKEHYILDIEDRPLVNQVIGELEKVTAVPQKKRKKNTNQA